MKCAGVGTEGDGQRQVSAAGTGTYYLLAEFARPARVTYARLVDACADIVAEHTIFYAAIDAAHVNAVAGQRCQLCQHNLMGARARTAGVCVSKIIFTHKSLA